MNWLIKERQAEQFLKKWLSGFALILVKVLLMTIAVQMMAMDRLMKWEAQLTRYWND